MVYSRKRGERGERGVRKRRLRAWEHACLPHPGRAAGVPRASAGPLERSPPPTSFSKAPAKPEPGSLGLDSPYDFGSCD